MKAATKSPRKPTGALAHAYESLAIADERVKAQDVRIAELESHRSSLAEALGKCIVASGIIHVNAGGLSGPQLLMFAEDLEAQLAAIGAGGVEPLRKRECLLQIAEPAPDKSVNAVADSLFDHQQIGGKVPSMDRDGFREIIGCAIDAAALQAAPPAQAIGWILRSKSGNFGNFFTTNEGHADNYVRDSGSEKIAVFSAAPAAVAVPESREDLAHRLIAEVKAADSIARGICQRVADLDDRSSPEGQPEMMLVTADELHSFICEALAAAPAQAVLSRKEWIAQATQVYVDHGDELKTAQELARWHWYQQDWISGELDDPREVAREDLAGRDKPAAAPAQEHATQLAGQGQPAKYVPVNAGTRNADGQHPKDDEPRTDACIAALNARGDDRGQGLDGYWKWGFAAGFNAAAPAQAQEGGPAGSGGWQNRAERMERERDYWRNRAQTMYEHQRGECWYWQGDGGDHIESMVNTLAVVIRADALRALLPQAQEDARDAGRLDFVMDEAAFIIWTIRDDTIKQCQLMTQDEDENYIVLSGESRYFNTSREAIDAARAAQGGA